MNQIHTKEEFDVFMSQFDADAKELLYSLRGTPSKQREAREMINGMRVKLEQTVFAQPIPVDQIHFSQLHQSLFYPQ